MTSTSTLVSYWAGLLPKTETEALGFISENPCYDGRGVVVGILDTGVDPGAIGLQITSTGLPKVIDIVDCSGSGDVMMGPLIAAEGTSLLGVGGKQLKLSENWQNPSGKYRVGIVRAYDLYPSGLKDRVSADRKNKWLLKHKTLEALLQRCLPFSLSPSLSCPLFCLLLLLFLLLLFHFFFVSSSL